LDKNLLFDGFSWIYFLDMLFKGSASQMQTNMSNFGERISLPDSWQRRALGILREGRDLVLHAPTGAGKTYVFEQLIESGWKGRAIYTVPTRALANDKFREWKKRVGRSGFQLVIYTTKLIREL
jgi:replicative superfamily II helicase